MSEKVCLILHRKSANELPVKEAVKTVQREGIDLRVRIPWNKKAKPVVVREALEAGAQRVIAGGGDGTINAVAAALVGKGKKKPKASLGILPLGTANDFARGCGLPTDDLAECLRIACTREGRPMDVGKVNKRYFINVASGGFGAEITATTPVAMKKALGGLAYSIMGMAKALKMTPYECRLTIPGEEPVSGQMLFMAVGNNRFAGGGFEVAPAAAVDDGLLDLAALNYQPEPDLARLAAEVKDPLNPDNKMIFYRQASSFTIESEQKLHCNLDGEPILKSRLAFSVLPRHLMVAY
jgi:lipid kinase YegS